jgi:hypothetical protein
MRKGRESPLCLDPLSLTSPSLYRELFRKALQFFCVVLFFRSFQTLFHLCFLRKFRYFVLGQCPFVKLNDLMRFFSYDERFHNICTHFGPLGFVSDVNMLRLDIACARRDVCTNRTAETQTPCKRNLHFASPERPRFGNWRYLSWLQTRTFQTDRSVEGGESGKYHRRAGNGVTPGSLLLLQCYSHGTTDLVLRATTVCIYGSGRVSFSRTINGTPPAYIEMHNRLSICRRCPPTHPGSPHT